MRPIVLAVLAVAALAACSPAEKLHTVDTRPSLLVKGASGSARVIVDNLDLGPADGTPYVLEPGTHTVRVVEPDGRGYSEKIFVSGAVMRTVTVPAKP